MTANDTDGQYFLCYKGGVDTNSELLYLRILEGNSSYDYVSVTHNSNQESSFAFTIDGGSLSAWQAFNTPHMTVTPNENISMFNKSAETFDFQIEVTNAWSDQGTEDHFIDLSVDFVNVDN